MQDLLTLIAELGGGAGILIFALWKWAIPGVKSLYQELKDLRKENTELKEKLAYYKGKYLEKHEHKSHGRKKE